MDETVRPLSCRFEVSLLQNCPVFDDLIKRIALHSGGEKNALVVPASELLLVNVSTVHRHEGFGLEVELFRVRDRVEDGI